MSYRDLIVAMQQMPWDSADPENIVHIFAASSKEFAESLRLALHRFPDEVTLKDMSTEELKTDNLQYEDYSERGDHSDFLYYFIDKHQIAPTKDEIFEAINVYFESMRKLSAEERTMGIASREAHNDSFLDTVYKSHEWNAPFGFFKYFLGRHIELDGEEGGHGDMLKHLEQDEA